MKDRKISIRFFAVWVIISLLVGAVGFRALENEAHKRCVVIRALVNETGTPIGNLTIPSSVPEPLRSGLQSVLDDSRKQGEERSKRLQAVADKYLPKHC